MKHRWWALTNWFKGYRFGAVQRFRCCDHTTPFHYAACAVTTGESKTLQPGEQGSPRENTQ